MVPTRPDMTTSKLGGRGCGQYLPSCGLWIVDKEAQVVQLFSGNGGRGGLVKTRSRNGGEDLILRERALKKLCWSSTAGWQLLVTRRDHLQRPRAKGGGRRTKSGLGGMVDAMRGEGVAGDAVISLYPVAGNSSK